MSRKYPHFLLHQETLTVHAFQSKESNFQQNVDSAKYNIHHWVIFVFNILGINYEFGKDNLV